VPVQQVHLDLEKGLADVGAAAIDDDDDVVVGVVSGVTPGSGTEEYDLPNTRTQALAHVPRELDRDCVGRAPRFHARMLARGVERVPASRGASRTRTSPRVMGPPGSPSS